MLINGMTGYAAYMQSGMQSTNASGRGSSQYETASVEFSIDIAVETVEETPTSVEDVKKEFAAFLDSLNITMRGTAIDVCVTDSAWEKMAADPEYKQKMMDLCKRDLCDPAWGTKVPSPAVSTIRIDADAEEEYLASSYGSAVTHMADTSGSFWSRRSERNKAALKEMEERALERRDMMAFMLERGEQRKNASAGLGYGELAFSGTGRFASSMMGGGAGRSVFAGMGYM